MTITGKYQGLILIASLFIVGSAFSQNDFKKNYIYLEAGGNGLWSSVNYERQITKDPGLGFRAGLGFYTEYSFYMTIPIGVNFLFKIQENKSFIDAGLGITWAKVDGKLFGKENNPNGDSFTNIIPAIYYRRHAKNNLIWKAGFTPVVNKGEITPWIALAIGKSF